MAEEAKRVTKKVFRDEVEAAKCRRSILMHNADKWVAGDQITQGYSLAERVTAAVHRICGGMFNVVDAFVVGAWQEGRMPSSVYLSFGSAQQKSTSTMETSSESSDMTSKNDVLTDFLTIFRQNSGLGATLMTPPSASQHFNQFLVAGRVECGGWRVRSRACFSRSF